MKKYSSIMSILVMVALVGCTKTELVPTQEKEITFAVGSYATATKASALQTADGGITSFKSYAVLHANGGNGVKFFTPADGVETISFASGTPNVWAPSHDYYWPKASNSYINFVSWYDKKGTPGTASETALSWTIDGSTRSLQTDDNIMFADEAWHYNQNPSAAYGSTFASTYQVSEGVPTLFHHALAQVKFQVRATTLADASVTYNVSISDFVIENVKKTGTLNLYNEDTNTMGTNPWHSLDEDDNTVDPYWDTTSSAADTLSRRNVTVKLITDSTPYSIMNTRSMIPQETQDVTVSFTLSIRTNYSEEEYFIENIPVELQLSDFTGDTGEWLMNHSITYTITVNPVTGKILFDPTLTEDWIDSPNNTMYVE